MQSRQIRTSRRSPKCFVCLLALSAGQVFAQSTDDPVSNVYRNAEPAVVQLLVTGKRDGNDIIPPSVGVACAFQTTAGVRLLTARHVVGADEQFDLSPGSVNKRQRDIAVRVKTTLGYPSNPQQTEHTIRAHPSMDVAEVFVRGADSATGLQVSTKALQENQRLIAVTWSKGTDRAIPTEVRVMPRLSDDGPLVRLAHRFVEGDSGSPVLDFNGALVAVILIQSGAQTLALPVAEFKDWVSPGVVPAESEEAARKRRKLAEMFDAVIAKMRESQIPNAEFVFPALERYKEQPTPARWAAVRDAVKRSLDPIEEGIKLSVQYDAQLDPLARNAGQVLVQTQTTADRTYSTTFTEVRSVWNGRFDEKQEILRLQDRLPTLEEISNWELHLKEDYRRLADLLSDISRQLVAQR